MNISGPSRKKTPWPAKQVERRPVASLKPYAGNARTHSKKQVEELAASIKEWGWTMPVLIDEADGVIAGHGRLLAARELGIRDVPVIVAKGWTESQKRAYVLADNQLPMNAGWDQDLLKVEIEGLLGSGFNVGLLGFGADGLRDILGGGGQTDPDAVPPEPTVPASQAGDVWLLGDHRLVCGDSTDPTVVAACLGGVKPHLMVTDPPYGVEYDADWRSHDKRKGSGGRLSLGAHAIGKVENDSRADWREAWALFSGDVAYVWHADRHASAVQASLEAATFEIRCQLVWAKNNFAIGRGDYHWQHEPCWYAVRKGRKGSWSGDRKQTTLWQIDKPQKSETGHSTQKPVECMKRPMENNSKAGDAVYEPFSGSGTTIIAGEMTGRRVLAIELSPVYVDVAVRRWQEFTGQAATLDVDGRSFNEITQERAHAKGKKETGTRATGAPAG